MAVWSGFVKRFNEDFTCIIFDMPGIGRSEILSGGNKITVEEQVEVLHGLVQETCPEQELTLAGSSWGTVITVAYAAMFPDAVQHMLIGSFGLKPNETMLEVVSKAQSLYDKGNWERGADLIIEIFGQQINPAYRRSIQNQFRSLSKANAEAIYHHCNNIASVGRLEDLIDMRHIKARTLIVNGADDTILDLEDMYVAGALIPNCETLLIKDAGHFLHFERPDLLELYAVFLANETACMADVEVVALV